MKYKNILGLLLIILICEVRMVAQSPVEYEARDLYTYSFGGIDKMPVDDAVDMLERLGYSGIAAEARGSDALDRLERYQEWSTEKGKGINYPHEIHFELPTPVVVKGFRYTPRQDFEKDGLIKKYEIYVTDHAYHWYTAVHTGEFKAGRETQVVMFDKPKAGRNIRLVALEGMNKNDRVATLAEFELITEELTDYEDVP